MKKLAIATLVLVSIAPAVRAADPVSIGFEPNSVNTWLADHGYRNSTTDANAELKRRDAVIGKKNIAGPAADQMYSEHLQRTKTLFPRFDAYPLYVQTALLQSEVNGDFAGGAEDPTVRSINTDNWASAAAAYHDRPDFAAMENYFAAKDAYDASPDKSTPAAKELAASMATYQGDKSNRSDLDRMQLDELAFLRFARENDIDRTWKRAVMIGNEGFAANNPADATSAYGANRGLTVADYNDYVNRQNRDNQPTGGASPTTPPLAFSVPNSTFGFADITVNRKTPFTFTLLDRHIVDGDIQSVTFVNGKGSQINQTITLTGTGQAFTVRVAKGDNELRIFAQNQGTLGVNSGGLRIGSPVVTGAADQDVSLLTGQTGILRVTGR